MKKAYIIMAHKNPRQFHRLVARLDDGASEFFIHIDQTADIAPFETVKEFGEIIHFVERVNSKWGSFGSVQASLNGLKAVKNTKKDFEHIFLLSGQDYPIKSNAYINRFLANSPHTVFMESFPLPDYARWPGRDRGGSYRVDKYYTGLKWYNKLQSKSINLLSAYIPFLRRKLPDGMKPYLGSQWWGIDSYALDYILDYDAKHPKYRAFHQYTFVPDELYIQMIVANSTDEKLIKKTENNHKRLMIWEELQSAHPNTLQKSDFEAIRSSEHLFARKFDETVDAEILNLIDREILQANYPVPMI